MKQFFVTVFLLLITATSTQAEQLVGLTANNQLILFNSRSPETVSSSVAITGLAAGDALAGIDVRPANNVLYGFATNGTVGKVYSISLSTGLASLSATLAANPADTTAPFPYNGVTGSFFGVDFNPVADALRVVGDDGQNLRINVTSGLTQLDVPVAYLGSDPNSGTPPQVYASAYTNSSFGATSTVLYNLDGAISNLVTQSPPNNGTLNSVALTSAIVFPDSAFDISGRTGTGFVVLDGLGLGTINLATGDLSDLGPIGTNGAFASINGLAVLVPEPATASLLLVAGLCGLTFRRRAKHRRH